MSKPIDQVRDELGAPDYESIETWRVSPAASATYAVAVANAAEDAERPAYGARYRDREVLLTAHDVERLLQAGAKEIKRPVPTADET